MNDQPDENALAALELALSERDVPKASEDLRRRIFADVEETLAARSRESSRLLSFVSGLAASWMIVAALSQVFTSRLSPQTAFGSGPSDSAATAAAMQQLSHDLSAGDAMRLAVLADHGGRLMCLPRPQRTGEARGAVLLSIGEDWRLR